MEEPLYDPKSFQDPDEIIKDEDTSLTEDDMEMFKQQVAEWIKLDEQIRKLSVALRERKVHQRALGSKIQQFMIKHNYDNLNTGQGRIRSKVKVVQQPLRVTEVRKKLEELGYDELVEKIFLAEREKITKQTLSRIIPKVSLSLDL